ncbi:MAG: cytochrome c [Hydrogenimonas sp.]|nr:cytochrome c [Hydrogenimonas sp.]
MKYLIIATLSALLLFAEESFITEGEYGQMLYENPRGIGCVHCHGKRGEGALIARYKDNGEQKELRAPGIREIPLAKLKSSLLKRHRVMPTYFLTDKEIRAIFYYLHMGGEE